jgi:hypothetical protein
MDDPLYGLSRARFDHCNGLTTGFRMNQPLMSGSKEVGDELSNQPGTLSNLSVGLNFGKIVSRGNRTRILLTAERPC